jgi:hypothetical protein
MPIHREGEYFISEDLAHVPSLGIESANLEACIARARDERFLSVFGHPSFGFTGRDLDFLGKLPWLESVWFWDVDLISIDGIYSLSNLRRFGVHPKRPPIDFGRLSSLREAIVEPRRGDQGLGRLVSLERLHYWHLRPRDRTFASFEFPESLTELQINWANAASLDSIPALPNLRRLEVHRCRNLESLGDLGRKFPLLEHVVVTTCGRLTVAEGERAARDLPVIEHFIVGGTKVR